MANESSQWSVVQLGLDDSLEASAILPDLARNKIAAINIGGFLCSQELDVIRANLAYKTIDWYANKTDEQGRIGINVTGFSHEADGKQKYFDATPKAEKERDEVFKGTKSPINRIIEFFSNECVARIATEPELADARYFTGLIRAMGAKSTLHYDYAPTQLHGWSVAEAEEQFGIVLYLQMPSEGGELIVYDRPWNTEDEVYNNDRIEKGTFGFTEGFLGDTSFARVKPEDGDLVVFNSRNFHQVGEMQTEKNRPRLGLTTFMSKQGLMLSLWS